MKKHVTRRPWTTKEDNFLVNNLNMPHKAIGKKLKRTSAAVAMRRQAVGIAKAHSKHTKIGPATVKESDETMRYKRYKAIEFRLHEARAARLLTPQTPTVPVYQYEGKHNIATFNKLGWFTRTLLGVRAA